MSEKYGTAHEPAPKPPPGMDQFNDPDDVEYGFKIVYRRGFVAEVACAWADWRAHHRDVRKAAPVTAVTLTNTLGAFAPGVAATAAGLKSLTVRGGGSDFMRWAGVVANELARLSPDTLFRAERDGVLIETYSVRPVG